MSTATLNPRRTRSAHGATPVTGHHRPHRVGDAVRAFKVFVTTAFGVVLLGEFAEEAGVRRAR
ncbi:hypothetical protein J7E90_32190 [Streptomyces sp. ISL-111]|uniref:hypothetical protein n=1 Tax=unclassified Streptomyces TaxID=2593676 RepID=UPI001BEBE842|nr:MULTISPECIES: hypothetical protein [unclassified Streptomyces]MBT2381820.1 hypothetical protein [Streptomyces sp. ISL-111]MBT2427941.1 hypothetical protein [Streptomyces sp. ISL-112]MBT2461552.1 hypothetical protein [Streptomyces sp. ISL-63]